MEFYLVNISYLKVFLRQKLWKFQGADFEQKWSFFLFLQFFVDFT